MANGITVKRSFLVIGLILLDQISKYIIRSVGGFYICNPSVAFGINVTGLFFWPLWLAVIFFILVSFLQKNDRHDFVALTFIFSGAMANGVDRIFFGCVIDFINLNFWPLFNLADCFIVLGAIIYAINIFNKSHVR